MRNRKKKLKSLVRIIFGRTMVVVLGLALQVFFLAAAFSFFYDRYVYVSIASAALSVIVIVWIINDNTNPYYKLAWIVPITLIPVFGTVVYVFVKMEWGTHVMNNRILKLIDETSPCIEQNGETLAELGEISVRERNLAVYMRKYAGYPVWKNTYAEYYPLGEDMFESMVRELENAKEFIFMEYFIVEKGEMWDTILEILVRKAGEGVDVRFMYDGMCSLTLVPYNYPKKLIERGIKCKVFSPIRPVLSTIQNNRDHRKITVIDGHTAYTGGINLADEYINKYERFGHWKDTAVMIKGEAAAGFTMMFLQNWNITEYGVEDKYEKFIRTDFPELTEKNLPTGGFVMPYGDSPLDNENVGQTVYLDILNRAEKYVHIMTPYLILDNEMTGALTYAAKRGVEVIIIMPHIPDKKYAYLLARSYYKELISAGVKIYEYTPGFVHAKSFVSDGIRAVVGSINLDYRSLFLHFECACYFYMNSVVRQVEEDVRKTLEKSVEITLEDCKRYNFFKRLAGSVLRIIAPLM
ncbi:MAG: cardiolipin synthase [Ruminococcus sp.]|nr:cardiolipin synthase [Ruminococcus sp.]MCM1480622.1 cardiolipin synthase [Muribaculaceae bacterium]